MMSKDLMSKDLIEKVDIVFECTSKEDSSNKGTHTPLVTLMKKVLQIYISFEFMQVCHNVIVNTAPVSKSFRSSVSF